MPPAAVKVAGPPAAIEIAEGVTVIVGIELTVIVCVAVELQPIVVPVTV